MTRTTSVRNALRFKCERIAAETMESLRHDVSLERVSEIESRVACSRCPASSTLTVERNERGGWNADVELASLGYCPKASDS